MFSYYCTVMAIFYALYFEFETSYVINSLNLFDFAFKVITTRSLENKLFIITYHG